MNDKLYLRMTAEDFNERPVCVTESIFEDMVEIANRLMVMDTEDQINLSSPL